MDLFNNREIALGIWILPLFLFLFKRNIRNSFGNLIRTFLNSKLSSIFTLAILYMSLIIYWLNYLNIWDNSQLKNTIMWGLTAGIVSFFSIHKASSEPNYFRTALLENFRIIIILEFLIGINTFELWQELIIVPFLVVIGGMIAVAEGKKEYRTVLNLLYSLLFIFGMVITIRVFILITDNFDKFAKTETLTDFTLPIILSTLFLPFLFCLALYMRYETAMVRINILTEDKSLRRYSRWRAMLSFRGKPSLIERWTQGLYTKPLSSKENIQKSIEDVLILWRREQNPQTVPFSKGWCPYKAKDFLKENNFITRYYHPAFEDEWHAESNSISLEDKPLANNIIYFVEGNSEAATCLKLKLYINHADTAPYAIQGLLNAASALCLAALGEDLPKNIETAILAGKEIDTQISEKRCRVLINEWPEDAYGENDILFIIQNTDCEIQ